jgi:plastocyanin
LPGRKQVGIAVGVLLAGFLFSASAGAATRLVATVGPGSSISLATTSGAPVKALRRGTYEIVVRDRSSRHNFHLFGPTSPSLLRRVNRTTKVPFVGSQKWTVRLRPGSYRYYCDPHREFMRGSFRVT